MKMGTQTAKIIAIAILCLVLLANATEQQQKTTKKSISKRSNAQRADFTHCDTCSHCNLVPMACQNLQAAVCSTIKAGQGVGSGYGYPTVLIARGTVMATATSFFTFKVTTCYPTACTSLTNQVLNVTIPTTASCKPSLTVGDDRVLAFNSTGTDVNTLTAYHSTCYYNRLYSQLVSYETSMLATTLDFLACEPWVITEIKVYPTNQQYIELYNSAPYALDANDLLIYQNNALMNTLVPVGPSGMVPSNNYLLVTNNVASVESSTQWYIVDAGLNLDTPQASIAYKVGRMGPSSFIPIDTVTWGAGFPTVATTGGEAAYLVANFDNNQYPIDVPRYNATQNDDSTQWATCVTSLYGTSTCTPGYINYYTTFPFGKRDTSDSVSVMCLLHHSAGLAYPQDFCGSKLFRSARESLQEAFPVFAQSNTFKPITYSPDALATALTDSEQLLVLGDPLIETLQPADLDAIERFVFSLGGSILANVNSQGQGALALVNRLLGRENSFSTNTADCRSPTAMEISQSSFVEYAEKKTTEFANACHSGLTCNGGISLAKDGSLLPADAQTTVCYAEVGVGRVFFITSWNAFLPAHKLLESYDNKQLLLNFLSSAFLL